MSDNLDAIFGDFYQTKEMTKAKKIISDIDSIFTSDLEVPNAEKEKFVVGCFNTTISHHKAITLLLSHGMDISALSLMRSLYEACIRGYWLLCCANDKEISKFGEGKFYMEDATQRLEVALEEQNSANSLYTFIKTHRDEYNDFTHCGRKLSEFTLDIDNITDEEIARHFNNANAITSFAITGLQLVTKPLNPL